MKKHSEEKPDWQEQRNRIIGLGESSLRKNYYPELREKVAELQKKNEELYAAYEQLASSEEELRENYEELSAKEQELRESEEKYRNLIENSFDGIMIHRDTNIVFLNRTALQLFGIDDIGEYLGCSIFTFIHPDYQPVVAQRADNGLFAIQQPLAEKFVRASGEVFDVEAVAVPVTWEGERAVQLAFRDITAQKKAEAALRESEQFYRTIFDTTGSASIIIGNDTSIIRANEGFARLSGYPIQELETGHCWTEFVVPDDLPRMLKYHADRRTSSGSAPLVYEFRFFDRHGRVRYCISNVAIIPGTTRSIASIVDISDRVVAEHALEEKNRELDAAYQDLSQKEEELRQNYEELITRERELRESEHRNVTLLHAIPDMMFVISKDGVYRDFSVPDPGVLAMPADTMLGRNIRDSGFGNAATEILLRHIGQALETGVLQQFEYELALPEGKRHFETRMVALSEDEALGIVRDITGKKRAEQDLRSAKTHLEAIYEGSPDLIYVHDADGRIIDVNVNVLTVSGFSREEILTSKPHEMSGEGYTSEMAMGYIQTALKEGKADFEWVSRKKTGEEFPVEMRLRRLEIVQEGGTIEPRVLAIGRDMTERRMAEQALAQGRKKLGLLNTIIFQDIQSTIFALSAYLQLANSTPDIEKIQTYTGKQNVLIQKIVSSLEFAKNYQDMGIHPPRWQNVTRVFLYALSHVDSLKVSRTVDLGTLEVYADMLLEKAIFNLLENSLTHGERVTEISLTYEDQNGNLVLVLQDNGVGIPESEKMKIFERGYGKNAGLGLFLVREILSITGMSITECGVEGTGARFEILIPKGVGRFPGTSV